MTTYDRHQAILKWLSERSSLKVVDLAAKLEVSEGTIRNDLTALEEQNLLRRVRGGAIPKNGRAIYPISNNRAQVHASEKKRIAQWAAELVNDGEVIFLDAGTTVLHMAPFLQDRRAITVLTNQLETAQILARDPSKTVILVGGVVKTDGTAVKGQIGLEVLKNLHIATAFISCVACSLESGLMEADMDEAAYKEQVVKSAVNVVALLDSSKFGKLSLKAFAKLEQIGHIVTDDGIKPEVLDYLKKAKLSLTVCGEHTIQSLSPYSEARKHYKIGFANLSEKVPFAVDVRRGLERAAKQLDNLDLIIADNDLSAEKAVQIADEFIEQQLDLVIEYQIDETIGNLLMNRFRESQIPVIAVDIPMLGATFFGVDNYQAGLMAGRALGKWIQEHWQSQLDSLIILEEKRAGPLPAARIQGQLHGLEQIIGPLAASKKHVLDSGNTSEKSYEQMLLSLATLTEVSTIAVLSFNDDAALGALQALRERGMDKQAAIVGQGADRRIREEMLKGNQSIVGSTSFNPEHYGEKIIALALKILKGEPVAPAVYIDHVFISQQNLDLEPEPRAITSDRELTDRVFKATV